MALAQFLKVDGMSYLDPHHTTRLSDVALTIRCTLVRFCSSCHRELSSVKMELLENAELQARLRQIES
jgi:5-methylcytosine-specific restriction enzyme A